LVLGFSVASLSAAPGNFCTDFSNLASSQVSPTSFVNGPKVPLLLINLSLLSTFSVSFISLIVLHGRRRRRRRRMRISLLLLRIVMRWLLLFQNLQ
jgi:hypothetical protein